MVITALQILVLSAYLLAVYNRYGILQSISHSTYKWVGNQRYWFTAMCWSLGALNLAQGMEGWGVLTTAGLMFAGITVDWMKFARGLHFVGAVLAIFGSFIGIWVMHGITIPFGIFLIMAFSTYHFTRNYVWWIEIQAFALILISYALR